MRKHYLASPEPNQKIQQLLKEVVKLNDTMEIHNSCISTLTAERSAKLEAVDALMVAKDVVTWKKEADYGVPRSCLNCRHRSKDRQSPGTRFVCTKAFIEIVGSLVLPNQIRHRILLICSVDNESGCCKFHQDIPNKHEDE